MWTQRKLVKFVGRVRVGRGGRRLDWMSSTPGRGGTSFLGTGFNSVHWHSRGQSTV